MRALLAALALAGALHVSPALAENGMASVYPVQGRIAMRAAQWPVAGGETNALTTAHNTLPCGTRVCVPTIYSGRWRTSSWHVVQKSRLARNPPRTQGLPFPPKRPKRDET